MELAKTIQSIAGFRAYSPNSPFVGGDVSEAVSFDGITDYLSRDTDLDGNADSKTFTFSCWVYPIPNKYLKLLDGINDTNHLDFSIKNTYKTFNVLLKNDNGDTIFQRIGGDYDLGANTWSHIIISVDLANDVYSTYINDVEASGSYPTVVDDLIDFDGDPFSVMYNDGTGSSNDVQGRLSHLFLDYTYRDLSIEANRRLFITADGKPATGLESLNPILYLPMKDASTAHLNLGTGGDFVQNGLLMTADRGANQDNCVMSEFDGSDDYLSSSDIGASDGKLFVFSCVVLTPLSSDLYIMSILVDGSTFLTFRVMGGDYLEVMSYTSDDRTLQYRTDISDMNVGRVNTITTTVDVSSSDSITVTFNGVVKTLDITECVNTNLPISSDIVNIGTWNNDDAQCKQCSIGELYFDTNYIDLAVSNPFWNSETNKPIPVKKAIATLGSNPLICMPIDASNPTKNYGSGGDFTLNGGGLLGARGMSEYISRGAIMDSDGYLECDNAFSAVTNSKYLSVVFAFNDFISPIADNTSEYVYFLGSNAKARFNNGYLQIFAYNDAGDEILLVESNATFDTDGINMIFFLSIDLTNTNNRYFYATGTKGGTPITIDNDVNYTTYTDDIIKYSSVDGDVSKIAHYGGIDWDINFIFIDNTYIDFSLEANRNLFRNQLGYPRNVRELIDNGTIAKPMLYLDFDDVNNFGANYGIGNDFVVNTDGVITAGADFKI